MTMARHIPVRSAWVWASVCLIAMGASTGLADAPDPPQPIDLTDWIPRDGSPLAVRQMIEQLDSDSWVAQAEAISLLQQWGATEATDPLGRIVADDKAEPYIRGRALVALARLEGKSVLSRAIASSRDNQAELRAGAVEALGHIDALQATRAIIDRLDDDNPTVRYRSAAVLARHIGESVWGRLEPMLTESPNDAVRPAAEALGCIGRHESRQILRDWLAAGPNERRQEILYGLADPTDPQVVAVVLDFLATNKGSDDIETAARRLLLTYEPDFTHDAMMVAAESKDPSMIIEVSRLLRHQPDPAIAQRLARTLRLVSDLPENVVTAALESLSQPASQPDAHVRLFDKYLGDEHPSIRARAIEALGACDGVDLFARLRRFLDDPSNGVRYAALRALDRSNREQPPNGGIVAYLSPVWAGLNSRPAQLAMQLIERYGTPDELGPAIAALNPWLGGSHAGLREDAAKALGALAGEQAAPIAQAQGYLTQWMVIGGFYNDEGVRDFDRAYPPEKSIDLDATYQTNYMWDLYNKNKGDQDEVFDRELTWLPWVAHDPAGWARLHVVLPPPGDGAVAYAYSEFTVPRARTVHLQLTIDNYGKVWHNGKQVISGMPEDPDDLDWKHQVEETVKLDLSPGTNRLLVKACNVSRAWMIRARLMADADGNAATFDQVERAMQ